MTRRELYHEFTLCRVIKKWEKGCRVQNPVEDFGVNVNYWHGRTIWPQERGWLFVKNDYLIEETRKQKESWKEGKAKGLWG